jgi:hypothetical protein
MFIFKQLFTYFKARSSIKTEEFQQELERDATERVRSIFNKIDADLYMEDPASCLDPNSKLDPSPLPKEVKEECKIWRNKFPHLR